MMNKYEEERGFITGESFRSLSFFQPSRWQQLSEKVICTSEVFGQPLGSVLNTLCDQGLPEALWDFMPIHWLGFQKNRVSQVCGCKAWAPPQVTFGFILVGSPGQHQCVYSDFRISAEGPRRVFQEGYSLQEKDVQFLCWAPGLVLWTL